jgi:DNA-binding response OmpR family regulator
VKKEVAVLETNQKLSENICALLSDHQYAVALLSSFSDLDSYLAQRECRAVILDLDTLAIDNRILRDFKRKNPEINLIAFSKRQYHPELEEALRNYISVCLTKPVNPDELFYWLRCVFENDKETKD